jgi:hypothetical protein
VVEVSRSKIVADPLLVAQTQEKIDKFPISMQQLSTLVLDTGIIMLNEKLFGKSLKEIIDSSPNKGALIGQLFPIAFNQKLVAAHPDVFRPEQHIYEKDIVCIVNRLYDFEIKVSTSDEKILGNQSYANNGGYKDKSSFYLAVNFDKIDYSIKLIRFGWLDIEDWGISDSLNGQGSAVNTLAQRSKMITIYKKGN